MFIFMMGQQSAESKTKSPLWDASSDPIINVDHNDFDDVYGGQIEVIKKIIPVIERSWNTANANGSLRCN